MTVHTPSLLVSPFDQQYAILRNQIIRGMLPPGSSIHPDLFSPLLGAGKAFFRLAFLKLEQEGLIEVHRRSARVRPLLREEWEELCEMRLAIEPGAIIRSREILGPSAADAISSAYARLAQAVRLGSADAHEHQRLFNLSFISRLRCPATFLHLERLHIVIERYLEHHTDPPYGYLDKEKSEAWIGGDLSRLSEITTAQIMQLKTITMAWPKKTPPLKEI